MTTLYQRSWPQMNETPDSLLATDEPPPFTVDNENGTSPLLIVADHAGKHFPRRLGQLGLSNAESDRHIAWDILLPDRGKALDAVVIRQNYSRLLIDLFQPYHDRIASELHRRREAGRPTALMSMHSFTRP